MPENSNRLCTLSTQALESTMETYFLNKSFFGVLNGLYEPCGFIVSSLMMGIELTMARPGFGLLDKALWILLHNLGACFGCSGMSGGFFF